MANNKIDTGVDKIGLAEGEVNFLKCTCIFSWQREEKLLLRFPLSGWEQGGYLVNYNRHTSVHWWVLSSSSKSCCQCLLYTAGRKTWLGNKNHKHISWMIATIIVSIVVITIFQITISSLGKAVASSVITIISDNLSPQPKSSWSSRSVYMIYYPDNYQNDQEKQWPVWSHLGSNLIGLGSCLLGSHTHKYKPSSPSSPSSLSSS